MSSPQPGHDAWPAPAQPLHDAGLPVPTAGPRRSPLAVTAFVAGVATVLVGATIGLLYPVVFMSADFAAIPLGVLQLVDSVLSGLLGLTATITGTVALVRRQAGAALAAAGTALGAWAVVYLVVGFAQAALYEVL